MAFMKKNKEKKGKRSTSRWEHLDKNWFQNLRRRHIGTFRCCVDLHWPFFENQQQKQHRFCQK